MTRRDQVDVVAKLAGITTAQARLALDAVAGLVKVGLEQDGRVALAGVGTFTVHQRSPRNVSNPRTGVIMELPASAVVKFRPEPKLRESVKEHHS